MRATRGEVRELRLHAVWLGKGSLVLRPLTERDWDLVLRLNADAEVQYFSDGDEGPPRGPDEVRAIYRQVSQSALCFVIEHEGDGVGVCWLQRMNLRRLKRKHPGLDCRRIDIELEKAFWGMGIGSTAVRLLTEYAFDHEGADAVFGCDVADFNLRSQRLFAGCGYVVAGRNRQPAGAKARFTLDFVRQRAAL